MRKRAVYGVFSGLFGISIAKNPPLRYGGFLYFLIFFFQDYKAAVHVGPSASCQMAFNASFRYAAQPVCP